MKIVTTVDYSQGVKWRFQDSPVTGLMYWARLIHLFVQNESDFLIQAFGAKVKTKFLTKAAAQTNYC